MQFISTRGGMEPLPYSETLLEGLATDGGLAVPQALPHVDAGTLASWRRLSYPELAAEVLGLFATDIPREDLARMTATPTPASRRTSCHCARSTAASRSSASVRGRLWRSRTWRCSSSARSWSTCWSATTAC
ncbi:hypothetical protein [Microbacterium sp. KUDC0406]|uniref:hypothetical protein n=1 Tax=Microbacterium sp. KUDC0406 TaxID=2909588 RepID=UPI002E2F3C7C|nr:hypothetical protein [Microbacterium sp. KUDC0406]